MKSFIFVVCALSFVDYYASGTISANVQCGGNTALKRPTLVSPTIQNTVCTYTIRPSSTRVCQVRLDFDNFTLAQPRLVPYPECVLDRFNVRDVQLCGVNTGQHIYVIQNITQLNQPLTISINTADRNFNPGLVAPVWSIRVTQLDCAAGAPLLEIEPKFEELKTHTTGVDSYWLAPNGCLQYFPETTGSIESFNLNNGAGTYMGDMRYSICFRRTAMTRGVRLQANIFQMSYGGNLTPDNEGFDDICYSSIETQFRSEDHVFLPFAQKIIQGLTIRASRYCASSLLNVVTELSPTGPMSILFNSDRLYEPDKPEIGFRFTYQVY